MERARPSNPLEERSLEIQTPASEENDNPRWVVMVFMGTSTVVGNAPLEQAALEDIAEMELIGKSPSLNLFVQRHGDGVPRRRHVGCHEEEVPPDLRDTEGGAALLGFVAWATGEALKLGYRHGRDHTMLVFWGHAYQFAIGHAQVGDGSIDALDFAELVDVFTRYQLEQMTRFGLSQPPQLDIVAFDACDLATIEIACQLRPFAKYLLASEMGVPIPGWPYDRVLGRLAKPEGRMMGPAEFGSWAIRRYCERYHSGNQSVSLTLLDLSQADRVYQGTEVLARRVAIAVAEDPGELELIHDLFLRSQTDPGKPFVDVVDLCVSLMRESRDVMVRAAAEALGDMLVSPAPVVAGRSESGTGRPFVADHMRNAARAGRLHGVSLYAPHVAPAVNPADRATELQMYQALHFGRESTWGQLVEILAQI
jgi:hypothetical protein